MQRPRRRYFKEAEDQFFEEAKYFKDKYKEIYRLEADAQGKSPNEILKYRAEMESHFKEMKQNADNSISGYSSKSSIGKAMNYFSGNYSGLTLFLQNAEVPIDNNP